MYRTIRRITGIKIEPDDILEISIKPIGAHAILSICPMALIKNLSVILRDFFSFTLGHLRYFNNMTAVGGYYDI